MYKTDTPRALFKKGTALFCALALMLPGIAILFSGRAFAAGFETGDVIVFGSYPKTMETDETLTAALDAAAADLPWLSLGYGTVKKPEDFAFYKDVSYGGERYRAILFTMYRSAYGGGVTRRDGGSTVVEINTVYWFRYEPIEWTVMDGESGLLIANSVLDAQPVNASAYDTYYADAEHLHHLNDYSVGSIRAWLSGAFLHTAFTEAEAAAIETKVQDNSADGIENTSDPVFLLSAAEAYAIPGSRVRYGSDYARAQGLYNYRTITDPDLWFLRNPGSTAKEQRYVSDSGNIYSGVETVSTDVGICPALYLNAEAYALLPRTPGNAPYAALSFDYADGVLTVSGSGAVPTEPEDGSSPFAEYGETCRAILLGDGIEAVEANAFASLTRLKTLVLNGPVSLRPGAFAENEALSAVICADAARLSDACFSPEGDVLLYEPKSAPHTGAAPETCSVLPYAFADGTLNIEGSARMDVYALLDLMAVMCGYYDGINYVRFDSYASSDIPLYVYSEAKGQYVRAKRDRLDGVRFWVQTAGGETITFNEFCEKAGTDGLDTFRLVADTDAGEEVKESTFTIVANAIRAGAERVLGWIVKLLNYMFSILSRFR